MITAGPSVMPNMMAGGMPPGSMPAMGMQQPYTGQVGFYAQM